MSSLLEGATAYLDTLDHTPVFTFDFLKGKGKVVVRVNYRKKICREGKRERITANFVRTGGITASVVIRNNRRYVELRQ